MKKILKVILDADDVLYDCNRKAIEKINKTYNTSYKKEDITSWGMMGNLLDERMKYFSDPTFIGNLPLYPKAKEFVHSLSKYAEVFVCTNVSPNCAGVRIDSLIKNFPEIPPENIIIGGRKDLLNADVMLDDAIHNLTNASVTYPVLMRQPWNRSCTGIISVTTYDEFLGFIKMIITNNKVCDNPSILTFIGPSGSGKTSIMKELLKTSDKFKRVVSYTTRPKREDEINGLDYNYVSEEVFLRMMDDQEFFETSSYMGNYYGTRIKDIEILFLRNIIPVFVLDINGAIAVKKHFDDSLVVYVKRDKEKCIKSVIERDIPITDKVNRIASLDAELKNEEFSDVVLENNDSIEKIVETLIDSINIPNYEEEYSPSSPWNAPGMSIKDFI